ANRWKGKTFYGIGEWMMSPRVANIPVDEYMALAKDFDPINFDAMAVAQLAKDAGMKYIVVTSKHHDGFAMYDSKANDFNIVKASPFGRDPLKELSEACKEVGIGLGFYYSHNQDWTFPGGNGGPKVDAKGKARDFDYYFKEKCLPQVKEIMTEYGDVAVVWFDTPGDMKKEQIEELVDIVRKYQPNAMISGRAGHNLGDYLSLGDMNIPGRNVPGLWETVDVTNDTWAYSWYDQNWKNSKQILKRVISTVARGGTYMLNMGPKPDGSVPVEAATALRGGGKWIDRYPQVIYKADPSPWGRKLPWGDVTVTDGKLNLCIYEWPLDGEIVLPGLKNEVKSAQLWVDGTLESLTTTKSGDWLTINLPAKRPEKVISVVQLEVQGDLSVNPALSIDPIYSTELLTVFAEEEDCTIEETRWMEKFGEWKHITHATGWKKDSKVTWTVNIMKPGYYETELKYNGNGRIVWRIENGGEKYVQNEQNSSHVYKYFDMGLLNFKEPGTYDITVSLIDGDFDSVNLEEMRLTPWENVE
ncbi:alpha-L-fucosidase, partial [Zobellia sp.]|nr:alpha-L-fucosidase [Zobellia sp.]